MKIQQLSTQVYIADQLYVSDINILLKLGINSVINNRPDNEEVGQPLSDNLSQFLETSGIDYEYLPIVPGIYTQAKIDKFTKLYGAMKKPLLIFCRTGNRAVNLWALSQMSRYGKEYVIDKAKNIGFDVSPIINDD